MSKMLIPSPCYVLEEKKLEDNLRLISQVGKKSGVDIILAFKGFAMWKAFPLIKNYVSGATASSLNEVKLCAEHMNTRAHTYCVAYRPEEIDEIISHSSHMTFNSLAQYKRFGSRAIGAGVSCGLRVNPEYSDVATELYNPSSPNSRLGILSGDLGEQLPEGIEGLHAHVLCESDSMATVRLLEAIESKFGQYLHHLKWINLGGGHLMTQKGYNTDHLISALRSFRERYDLEIILEPGSAFAWQIGFLKTTVLDIVNNGGVQTAVIDGSLTCHMPDTLEMPYRPEIRGASKDALKFPHSYRIGGVSCLAGDFLEAYSFDQPLEIGQELIFEDMIHYTMVKTTMFNGVHHPSIGMLDRDGDFHLVRQFDYEDYRCRLS